MALNFFFFFLRPHSAAVLGFHQGIIMIVNECILKKQNIEAEDLTPIYTYLQIV